MRIKLITFCFLVIQITLFVTFLETDLLLFVDSTIPFYLVYLISTLKASEFSVASESTMALLVLLTMHIATGFIYGAIGFVGSLMFYLFHKINKRSLIATGRFARMAYGASYVAQKATGADISKLSNYDIAITIVAIAASFAFYFITIS